MVEVETMAEFAVWVKGQAKETAPKEAAERQEPPSAKHPLERLMPFWKVEVPPETVRFLVTLKSVEVALVRRTVPKVEEAEFRFSMVEEASVINPPAVNVWSPVQVGVID